MRNAAHDEPELLTLPIPGSRTCPPPIRELEPPLQWLRLGSDLGQTHRPIPEDERLRRERLMKLAGSLPSKLAREIEEAVQDAFENEDDGE